ncbi:hypothetical protein MPER_07189 [Moniliophthora perniciosa FA553]|nr:hypothetical protein MPER_07189 [Moniliophthora perniciosa FA553]
MLCHETTRWALYLGGESEGVAKDTLRELITSVHHHHFSRTENVTKIVASNIGLMAMTAILHPLDPGGGIGRVPEVLVNHWIVMLTFLHHSDPTIPYYRNKEWTFLRGATATVDRPLLGWAGRFFFHNVSHDHIAHHLFSSIPFYNQPQVTERLKEVLKSDYNYDSTNSFRALYRSFTECCFIEDEGDIVFYMNRNGQTARSLAVKEGT